MTNIHGVEIKADHTKEFMKKLEEAIDLALEECGSECERYAKMKCPVDTGLLRNSITYAMNGKEAKTSSYQSNSRHARTPVTERNGTAGKPVNVRSGTYSGTADNDKEPCVYIGSNVFYSGYVEMGSSHYPTPQPYLKPALEEHTDKYKDIFKKHISAIDN